MDDCAVMLLAAGRGMRLRPLTDTTPKPLLRLNGKSLIELHLQRLAKHYQQVVINVAYKKELIKHYLGDGARYGIHIIYSDEGEQGLETAGGIHHALPLLGGDVVLVISADVYTDWQPQAPMLPPSCCAHLLLVDNPAEHPDGDFFFADGQVMEKRGTRLTFSGIAYYRREFFDHVPSPPCKLSTLLQQAQSRQQLSAEHYQGLWINVSDAKQLSRARQCYRRTEIE